MNRLTFFMYPFALLLMFAAALPARASIDAPDHVYYGTVSLYGQPAPAGTVIEARSVPAGQVLMRHVLGSNTQLGGLYRLNIPMDQVDPRTPGRARPGDPIRLHVAGQLAAETSVGAVGVTTRLDLDPQNTGTGPAISIAHASAYEGQEGLTPVELFVTLSAVAASPVGIHWETRNDTAIGGAACAGDVDFVQTSGTLTIPAGQMQGTLTVQVCGDTAVEPNEQFSVVLLSTVDDFGVLSTQSTATVTILDDDNVPTLSVGNVRIAEPTTGTTTARFRATLSRAHENDVSFTWATQSATAQAGSDFLAAGGTVTIAANDLDVWLEVTILADAVVEPDETFRLHFSNPQSLILSQTYAYGTIVDPRHDPVLEETDAVSNNEVPDLLQPSAIALSPDGTQAYATALTSNAVLRFHRDPASGALSHASSYKDAAWKLRSPQDIALSPDGNFVYVAAQADNVVTVLAHDPEADDGSLIHVQSRALTSAMRLAISPDGAHVYAVGRSSGTVTVFTRDAGTGELTSLQTLTSSAPGLGSMSQPSGIAISPDGQSVYVTALGNNALYAFTRQHDSAHPDVGKLSLTASYINGLGTIPSGLAGPYGIALSPNGKQVYVALQTDNGVAQFDRATDGTLTLRQRHVHGTGAHHGLKGAHSVEVAPNGKEVFVTGAEDDSLTVFRRDTATGVLSVRRTLFKGDSGTQHLASPGAMVSSTDDRYLYVAANGEGSAIVTYYRLSASELFEDGFEPLP